jgi:hypothetical protein
MRKLSGILSILILLILIGAYSQEILAEQRGPIVVPKNSYDFGSIKQGNTVAHTFVIRNTSDKPVRIERMGLSDAGMTARGKSSISPGSEGTIAVSWDTSRVQGKLSGEAVLYFDDPALPPIALLITGVVKPPLEFLPFRAVFLRLFKGETAEGKVTIINNEDRPLAIQRVEPRGQHFRAAVQTVDFGKVYEIHVKARSDTPPGRYREALEVYTDRSEAAPIRLAVNILVRENLYTFPDIVDFGTVSLKKRDDASSALDVFAQTLLVKRRQGNFEIKNIVSSLPFLRIRQEPASKSATYRLDIRLDPNEMPTGRFVGSLRIMTDDVDFPEIVVPVRGNLK